MKTSSASHIPIVCDSNPPPMSDNYKHEGKGSESRRPPTPHPESGGVLSALGHIEELPDNFFYRAPVQISSVFAKSDMSSIPKADDEPPAAQAPTDSRSALAKSQNSAGHQAMDSAPRTITLPIRPRSEMPQSGSHPHANPAATSIATDFEKAKSTENRTCLGGVDKSQGQAVSRPARE